MKKLLLCLVLVALLVSLALPAGSALADDDPWVCLSGTGLHQEVTLTGYGDTWAGLFHMTVDGTPYDGWCIDLTKEISRGQCFDANLVDASREPKWCAIAFIMNNFDPYTSNNEAAAIQLVIWKYIYGGKYSVVATSPSAVETRACEMWDAAEGRSVNLWGPGLGLTLAEGAGGPTHQDFIATVTGSGCLEGIAVDFSTTAGTLSSPTVLTNASGKATVTLSWGAPLPTTTVTACAEGYWPVIIKPLDSNIQRTVILKPFGLTVFKQFQEEPGPGLEVSKEADTEISKEGDEITYTITVKNTGDVDLNKTSIIDSLLGNISGTFVKDPLVAGDSESHTFPYVVQPGDDDPLVNEVEAIYEDEAHNAVSDVATDTVDLVHPDLEVTKTADPTSGEVDDTITYTITVENTGDVALILDSVEDTLLGSLAGFASTLGVGAFESNDFDRDILSTDLDPLVNTVTFHYHPEGLLNDITDEASAEVRVITLCNANIEGYKFANRCCTNGTWDTDNCPPGWECEPCEGYGCPELPLEGWKIGLFTYEYPYAYPDWLTALDTALTDTNGKFTFENVCAGAYYVVEEKLIDWKPCISWFENYPLRDHYVVVVTEANAINVNTITYDVYGDQLLFGNKHEWGYNPFGQLFGVTAQAEGPC